MEQSLTGKQRRESMNQPPLLNMMLLGSVGSGKSASGNTIIGDHTFKEDFSPEAVTRTCESAQTEENGQTITVIDTVGLCDAQVEKIDVQTEIEQILQNTNLDVLLLVIKLDETFTQKKTCERVVKWIQDSFGEKALKHTIVLFTHGDLIKEPVEDYLNAHAALQSVVDQCSGGFHVFNNRDKDRAQVTELLEKINRLRVKNEYSRYTEWDYGGAQKNLKKNYAIGVIAGAAAGAAAAVVGTGGLGAAGGASAVTGLAAAGGSVLSTVGIVAGAAAGGAALGAAAVGAGIYFMAKEYTSKKKD